MEKDNLIQIAEKVKFWEEQDRINQALIPRVLKNHDMIADLTNKIAELSNIIASLEIKVAKNQSDLEKMSLEIINNKKKESFFRIISLVALILSVGLLLNYIYH